MSALVRCPLCGARFPAAAACPPGCPLARGCRTVCCPNCKYRFVVSSTLLHWLDRLVGRRTA